MREELPPTVVAKPAPHAPSPAPRPTPPVPRPPSPAPRPTPPVPRPSLSFREIVAMQTLLDRHNLSCNCADGVIGPRTQAALTAFQERSGLPATGEPDGATLAKLGSLDAVFTTHVVTTQEVAGLAPVPRTWLGKSQVPRLGFETVLETVAEEYHAAQKAIVELNPGVPWPNPPAGTLVTVPNPRPVEVEPTTRLTISLGRKLVRAYRADGQLIAQFPCSIAKDKSKRPIGEITVANCAADPNYTLDPAVFLEDAEVQALGRKLLIPPGPNNPVGVAWISLSLPGYGIHGTAKPEDIGETESHGCFRLANWNAKKLLEMISIGMPVVVE